MADTRSSRSAAVRIGPDDRRRLAELVGRDADSAKADLDRLEIVLNDSPFIVGIFEQPKPNEVRALIAPRRKAGLKKKALALREALHAVPWQVALDYKENGFDLEGFRKILNEFTRASDAVLSAYAGEKTARRAPQRVRDRHIIPEIADLFDRMCGRDKDLKRDWEHTDNQCAFVALALKCAGIPFPGAGDTNLGEQSQGRLRRLLKAHDDRKRQAQARGRSRAAP